jgi:hypothetical protein
MTKTLVALVLIAGGILPVTRLVDTEKSVPARLSPPTGADQISEARRVSPTMSARDVAISSIPGRSAPFRSRILWLSILRSPPTLPP